MQSCKKLHFIQKNKTKSAVFASRLEKKRAGRGMLFLLPGILGTVLFLVLPFLDLVRRSFLTAVTEQFCGLKNYQMIWTNQAFLLAVKNTLRFVFVCIPILVFTSLLLAVMLSGCRWMQLLKSIYLFPLAVPTATVVLVWKMFFFKGGLLNKLVGTIGMAGVDWLGTDAAFWVLVISYVWKNLGYTIVLWLAGIGSVSTQILEAAQMDGADLWQRFWYIIWPNLRQSLYTISILSFLNSFKVFREAYLVAGAYPQQSMYLLQHIFNNWFTNLELDKMAAAAVCITVVFFLMLMMLQRMRIEKVR